MLCLRVRLKDNWRKPRFKLLLGNVCLNQMKAFVPKRLMTILHSAVIIIMFFLLLNVGTRLRLVELIIVSAKVSVFFYSCKCQEISVVCTIVINFLKLWQLDCFTNQYNSPPSCIIQIPEKQAFTADIFSFEAFLENAQKPFIHRLF